MAIRNASTMGAYGSTWQARGYCGQGQVDPLLGSIAGRAALVCGNGAGVFAEFEEARAAVSDPVVFAVNDAGMYLPVVHHWVSLHVDSMLTWRAVRWQQAKYPEKTQFHSDTARPWLDWYWQQLTPQFCLSGYYAMQLAWVMGAERIVLCGCPGDGTRRWFDAMPRQDFAYGQGTQSSDHNVKTQLMKEMSRLPDFKAAVRSMSGWTKTYFGGLDHG